MNRIPEAFDAHPAPASDAGEEAFALVEAAAQCVAVCTTCADACLEEDAPASLRQCIRINQDCADICAATARLIARPGEQDPKVLRAQLDACVQACLSCAVECDGHADGLEHCRICADACRSCAEACKTMKKALVA